MIIGERLRAGNMARHCSERPKKLKTQQPHSTLLDQTVNSLMLNFQLSRHSRKYRCQAVGIGLPCSTGSKHHHTRFCEKETSQLVHHESFN
jgi:hypothetical protein